MLKFDLLCIYRHKVYFHMIIPLLCLLLTAGCIFTHHFVGEKFNTDTWPKYSSGKKVILNGSAMKYEFIITETDVVGEYKIEGTMDGSKGSLKSINHLDRKDTNLFLILAKDGVVINCFPFMPLGLDHTHKLPFQRKFISKPFDSVNITGQISVSG